MPPGDQKSREFHYVHKIREFVRSLDSEDTIVSAGPTDASRTSRTPERLAIFDFDNTLFHSPCPNRQLWSPRVVGMLIEQGLWYRRLETLSPPYVPEKPAADWFAESVVRDAVAANDDANTVSVLMTGRLHHVFAERIGEIVAAHANPRLQQFDMRFYKEEDPATPWLCHASTMEFKLSVLGLLLDTFPSISTVEMWDDRPAHVARFQRELDALVKSGRVSRGIVHLIVEGPRDVKHLAPKLETESLIPRMLAYYNDAIAGRTPPGATRPRPTLQIVSAPQHAGIHFSPDVRAAILAAAPPLPPNAFPHAEHCVLWHGAPPAAAEEILGKSVAVRAVAFGVADGRAAALRVELDDSSGPLFASVAPLPNQQLSIIAWIAAGARSRDAAAISEWRPLEPPRVFQGILGCKMALDAIPDASQV